MHIDEIREYALAKVGVEECFPFGESTFVFKVQGKIFLLLSLDSSPMQFNVKCDPERAIELRDQYANIVPGYHMNKRHWNTIITDQTISARLIREMIDHSYELVYKKPKTKSK